MMTRIKRRKLVLINCGPPNASKDELRHLLRIFDPFFTPLHPPRGHQCPNLVIKTLIMVIVIRTNVITVVMVTIADM